MSLKRPELRALLVDFDGTLADTLSHLKAVYARFVTERGGAPSEEQFQSFNGPPIADVVKALCRQLGLDDVDAQLVRYNAMIDGGFATIGVMNGARELFAAAAERKIACRIVTSNSHARVTQWLDANGLADQCTVIVSGDDDVAGKPSPEPYLRAIEKLNLSADQAMAIEDSVSGARSAVLAGLRTLKLGAPVADSRGNPKPIVTLHDAMPWLEPAARW